MTKLADKLIKVLLDKKTVITKAFLWRIPHNSGREDVRLKVGRYKKGFLGEEQPESVEPKSELTFDNEEFEALVQFLQENYEPFKQGFKAFIPIDRPFTSENADQVRKFFSVPDKTKLVEFIFEHNVIPFD